MQSNKTKRQVPGSDDWNGKRGHEGQDSCTGDDSQDDKGPIPRKRATVNIVPTKFVVTEVSDQSSNIFDSYKICCDNVDEESIRAAMASVEQKMMPKKAAGFSNPHCRIEKDYQAFLVKPMQQALTEYWGKNTEEEALWKDNSTYVSEYQPKVYDCSIRVVREAAFDEKTFSANFVTFTTSRNKPDIALEICDKSLDQSNAILVIEVDFATEPVDNDELWANLRQLICDMVSFQRPVVQSGDGHYLLYGLLLYRSVAYQVELESHVWLDYPWKCVSICQYCFEEYDVMGVLSDYICAGLGGDGKAICKDELFKLPHELKFPKFPEDAVHMGLRGNVVKVRWGNASEYFPDDVNQLESKSSFTRLPDVSEDEEVIIKIVTPTIYLHGGIEGFAQIETLCNKLIKITLGALTLPSGEAQRRLQSVANMYIHIGPRGKNDYSKVVVTHFKGKPVPNNPDVMQCWQAMFSATAEDEKERSLELRECFFDQVCLVALDFVQFPGLAHYDIRLANVVFTDDNFALIDWEDARPVTRRIVTCRKPGDTSGDQRYPEIDIDDDTIRWLVYSAYQLYMVIFTIDMAAARAPDTVDVARAVERAFRGGLWQCAVVKKQTEEKVSQPSTSTSASQAPDVAKEGLVWHSERDASLAWGLLSSQSRDGMSSSIVTENDMSSVIATEVDSLTDDETTTVPATEDVAVTSIAREDDMPCLLGRSDDVPTLHATGDDEGDMASDTATKLPEDDFQTDKENASVTTDVTKSELTAVKPESTQLSVEFGEEFVKWSKQRIFMELCNVEDWNKLGNNDVDACREKLHKILRMALTLEVEETVG